MTTIRILIAGRERARFDNVDESAAVAAIRANVVELARAGRVLVIAESGNVARPVLVA